MTFTPLASRSSSLHGGCFGALGSPSVYALRAGYLPVLIVARVTSRL